MSPNVHKQAEAIRQPSSKAQGQGDANRKCKCYSQNLSLLSLTARRGCTHAAESTRITAAQYHAQLHPTTRRQHDSAGWSVPSARCDGTTHSTNLLSPERLTHARCARTRYAIPAPRLSRRRLSAASPATSGVTGDSELDALRRLWLFSASPATPGVNGDSFPSPQSAPLWRPLTLEFN